MLRQHDVVVAEGTFRIVLTDRRRLYAVIDAKETMLGPVRLAFEIDRGIHPEILRRQELALRGQAPNTILVGGIFDDIGNFVTKAAEGAFNTASKAVTTITKPVFNIARDAASHVTHAIASVTPFLPSNTRDQIHAAARVVARARLGDVTAKEFMRSVGSAAKAGIEGARKVGDALLEGTRLVARVADLPVQLLGKVPVVGDLLTSISPLQKFDKTMGALQRGDFRSIGNMVENDLRMAQGVVSLVPGIGTGISSAVSAGLAVLDGGSPLEVAINAAYGAIPIPPGIRTITDTVLASVMELAKSGSITDAVLAGARNRVPAGLPRDVFDTLANIVVKRVPVVKASTALASHYIEHYAGEAGSRLLGEASKHVGDVSKLADMAQRAIPIGNVAHVLPNFDQYAAPFTRAAAQVPKGPAAIAQAVRTMHFPPFTVSGEDMDLAVGAESFVVGEDVSGGEDVSVGGETPVAGEIDAYAPELPASGRMIRPIHLASNMG